MADDQQKDQEIRDIVEKAASRVLADKLGLALGPDGRVNPEDVDQEELKKHVKPVAIGMLGAIANDLKQAGHWDPKITETGDEGETPSDENASARQVIETLGLKVVQTLSSKLNDKLGIPLNEDGVVDTDKLEDDEVQQDLAGRITALFNAVGNTVEDIRDRMVQVTPGPQPAETEEPPPAAEADTSGTKETQETEGEDTGARVLDFDQWKKRIEDKRSSVFKLGDTLQESINRFIQQQTGEVGPDGNMRLNLNQDFFRDHGAAIIQQAFQEISKKFVPPKIEVTLPMDERESEPAKAEESEGKGDGVKLSVNLDLGSIFGKMFKKKSEEETEEGDSEPTP